MRSFFRMLEGMSFLEACAVHAHIGSVWSAVSRGRARWPRSSCASVRSSNAHHLCCRKRVATQAIKTTTSAMRQFSNIDRLLRLWHLDDPAVFRKFLTAHLPPDTEPIESPIDLLYVVAPALRVPTVHGVRADALVGRKQGRASIGEVVWGEPLEPCVIIRPRDSFHASGYLAEVMPLPMVGRVPHNPLIIGPAPRVPDRAAIPLGPVGDSREATVSSAVAPSEPAAPLYSTGAVRTGTRAVPALAPTPTPTPAPVQPPKRALFDALVGRGSVLAADTLCGETVVQLLTATLAGAVRRRAARERCARRVGESVLWRFVTDAASGALLRAVQELRERRKREQRARLRRSCDAAAHQVLASIVRETVVAGCRGRVEHGLVQWRGRLACVAMVHAARIVADVVHMLLTDLISRQCRRAMLEQRRELVRSAGRHCVSMPRERMLL